MEKRLCLIYQVLIKINKVSILKINWKQNFPKELVSKLNTVSKIWFYPAIKKKTSLICQHLLLFLHVAKTLGTILLLLTRYALRHLRTYSESMFWLILPPERPEDVFPLSQTEKSGPSRTKHKPGKRMSVMPFCSKSHNLLVESWNVFFTTYFCIVTMILFMGYFRMAS